MKNQSGNPFGTSIEKPGVSGKEALHTATTNENRKPIAKTPGMLAEERLRAEREQMTTDKWRLWTDVVRPSMKPGDVVALKDARDLALRYSIPFNVLHKELQETMVWSLKDGDLHYGSAMAELFEFPQDILDEVAERSMGMVMSSGRHMQTAHEIAQVLHVTSEKSLEIANKKFLYLLGTGDAKLAFKVAQEFGVTTETAHSAEAIEAAKKGIGQAIYYWRPTSISNIRAIEKGCGLSREDLVEALTKWLLYSERTAEEGEAIAEAFDLPENAYRDASIERIMNHLTGDWRQPFYTTLEQSRELIGKAGLTQEDAQEIVKRVVKQKLADSHIEDAFVALDAFEVPQNLRLEMGEREALNQLTQGNVKIFFEIVHRSIATKKAPLGTERFYDLLDSSKYYADLMASPKIREAAHEGLVRKLTAGDDVAVRAILQSEILPTDTMGLPDVLEAAARGISAKLRSENIDLPSVKKVALEWRLPVEAQQAEAVKTLVDILSREKYEDALRIAEIFSVSPEKVREVAQEVFLRRLSSGETDLAFELATRFELSKEFVTSSEALEAAQKGVVQRLSRLGERK